MPDRSNFRAHGVPAGAAFINAKTCAKRHLRSHNRCDTQHPGEEFHCLHNISFLICLFITRQARTQTTQSDIRPATSPHFFLHEDEAF